MTETDLMNTIRLKLSEIGYKNFRINVGKVRLPDGRWFSTGVQPGFSDLFAVQPVTGRAVFIECKVGDNKTTPEQLRFIKVMREQGALAGVAYSVEDALKIAEGKNG